ncbi:hypothetical protein VTJ04DRAFT_5120 [Mycothermus thermophilus]|uniref:uncharacterized protein n=1 Tax=Humicola insolens TaxID=85995 RepID=UPI003743262B
MRVAKECIASMHKCRIYTVLCNFYGKQHDPPATLQTSSLLLALIPKIHHTLPNLKLIPLPHTNALGIQYIRT